MRRDRGKSRSQWITKAPPARVKFQEIVLDERLVCQPLDVLGGWFKAGFLVFALGCCPDDPYQVAALSQCDVRELQLVWPAVRQLFQVTEDGLVCPMWLAWREQAYAASSRGKNASAIAWAHRRAGEQ